MKFKSFAAAVLSAVITLCAVCTLFTANAETSDTEKVTYNVSYKIDPDQLYTDITDEDLALFESFDIAEGEYVDIPKVSLHKNCNGWTYDGVFLREAGDFFRMPDHDIVLEPVYIDNNGTKYTLSYDVFQEGMSVSDPDYFTSGKYYAGSKVTLTNVKVNKDGWTHIGWLFEGAVASVGDKLIMPDHDVTVEPRLFQFHDCYYEAGTTDRLNGPTTYCYSRYYTNNFELATADRFSRNGFQITGWLCDYDNKVYPIEGYYTMPDCDVHFYAVWEPKTYTVVFRSLSDIKEVLKVAGQTDTYITVPDITSTKKGYEFLGWTYDGFLYKPGSEFLIKGAVPGKGISLDGAWWEPDKHQDSLTLVEVRKQYANGEITEEELKEKVDFILGRK